MQAQNQNDSTKIGKKLAPFNPANHEVVEMALDMLQLCEQDVLYDLGCGDARLLVKACTLFPTVRAKGIEYDYDIYQRACALVESSGFNNERVQILHDNVLNIDFSEATCIFVYLVPEGMALLKTAFQESLERGVRIVSYVFSIPDLTPTEVRVYKGSTKLYLYTRDRPTQATVGGDATKGPAEPTDADEKAVEEG